MVKRDLVGRWGLRGRKPRDTVEVDFQGVIEFGGCKSGRIQSRPVVQLVGTDRVRQNAANASRISLNLNLLTLYLPVPCSLMIYNLVKMRKEPRQLDTVKSENKTLCSGQILIPDLYLIKKILIQKWCYYDRDLIKFFWIVVQVCITFSFYIEKISYRVVMLINICSFWSHATK